MGDEDLNFFFARIFRLETTMRSVGMEKRESEMFRSFSTSFRNATML